MSTDEKIYTHDFAAMIIDMFETILDTYGIKVPSPEDDERDPESCAGLYGSVYADLLDNIEYKVIELLEEHTPDTEVVSYKFSGAY